MDSKADNGIKDETLIAGYLAGNPEDFNTLYERYKRQLYAYLNKMLDGSAVAPDDIFQLTWIKAVDNLPNYEHKQLFLAWLIRIAHNIAVDHFRKAARSSETSLDASEDGEPGMDIADPGGEPWRKLHQEELAGILDSAVNGLAPELRTVFLLRRDDIPFKEIERIQNCSINTVLARMQYALKNLRKTLGEWKQKEGGA